MKEEILKLISESSRLNILKSIQDSKNKICVGDISTNIDASHSLTSHHLSKLEKAGIIKPTRNGREICYVYADTAEAKFVQKIVKLFL